MPLTLSKYRFFNKKKFSETDYAFDKYVYYTNILYNV